MSLADAFAPAESEYRNRVLSATFGHLAPEFGKSYPGTITFAVGEYNDYCCIADTTGVQNSPWYYELLTDWLCEQSRRAPGVYRWTGSFRPLRKDMTKASFRGKIKKVELSALQ